MDGATRLALAAARGDRRAAEELVRRTQTDVWRWCAHLGDRDRADDLTQETYVRAWRSLPRFRGEASVRTWLFQIAGRVVADDIATRQRRRRDTVSLTVAGHNPREPDHATSAVLTALVRDLDEDRRAALVLTQVLGYSYLEAADLIGCPVGTIRSRVARARTELVTRLDDVADGHRRSG